jgi:outer membrane lipoprotein-sorting protein
MRDTEPCHDPPGHPVHITCPSSRAATRGVADVFGLFRRSATAPRVPFRAATTARHRTCVLRRLAIGSGNPFSSLEEMPSIPTMPKNRTFTILALMLAATCCAVAPAQDPKAPAPAAAAPAPVPAAAPAPAGSVEAAQAKAAPVVEPPTDAEKALDAAIVKLAALTSVSADMTEAVDMLEQKFTIRGRYRKAPNRRVYLQLKVSGLADATAQMVQVCDGQTLWDYQQVLESQTYTRLDINPILEKLKAPELDDTIRDGLNSQMGFAGPDELLRGLRKAVKFDDKTSETLDVVSQPLWRLHGVWTSRDGLMGPNQQPLPLTMPLPAYVPYDVIVWIGQNDGWPYKLMLVGRRPPMLIDNRKVGADGKRIGSLKSVQDVKPSAITILYSNVKLNPDLKADEFAFTPPQGTRVEDRTQTYVSMLDQAIQVRTAAKKNEDLRKEDPLLKQSIELPKSAPPAAPSVLPSIPEGTAGPSGTR